MSSVLQGPQRRIEAMVNTSGTTQDNNVKKMQKFL